MSVKNCIKIFLIALLTVFFSACLPREFEVWGKSQCKLQEYPNIASSNFEASPFRYCVVIYSLNPSVEEAPSSYDYQFLVTASNFHYYSYSKNKSYPNIQMIILHTKDLEPRDFWGDAMLPPETLQIVWLTENSSSAKEPFTPVPQAVDIFNESSSSKDNRAFIQYSDSKGGLYQGQSGKMFLEHHVYKGPSFVEKKPIVYQAKIQFDSISMLRSELRSSMSGNLHLAALKETSTGYKPPPTSTPPSACEDVSAATSCINTCTSTYPNHQGGTYCAAACVSACACDFNACQQNKQNSQAVNYPCTVVCSER